MPIQIIDGFKLGTSKPIDDRIVASGSVARFAIPNKYDGLLVVDTKDHKPYIWNADSGTWSTILSGDGGVPGSVIEVTNNTYVGNTDNVYIGGGTSTTKNVYIGDTTNNSNLNVSNNLNVTGVISGDGSNIKNINPSNLSTNPGSEDQVLQLKLNNNVLTPTWSTIKMGGTDIIAKGADIISNYYIGFIDKNSGTVSNIYNVTGIGAQNGVLYSNGLSASVGTFTGLSASVGTFSSLFVNFFNPIGLSASVGTFSRVFATGLSASVGTFSRVFATGLSASVGTFSYAFATGLSASVGTFSYAFATGLSASVGTFSRVIATFSSSLDLSVNRSATFSGDGRILTITGNSTNSLSSIEIYKTISSTSPVASIGYYGSSTNNFIIKNRSTSATQSIVFTDDGINLNINAIGKYGVIITNSGKDNSYGLNVLATFTPTQLTGVHSCIIARFDSGNGSTSQASTYITRHGLYVQGDSISNSGAFDKPSIAFNGSPTTGFYSDSPNKIGISSKGVEKMSINTDGVSIIGGVSNRFVIIFTDPNTVDKSYWLKPIKVNETTPSVSNSNIFPPFSMDHILYIFGGGTEKTFIIDIYIEYIPTSDKAYTNISDTPITDTTTPTLNGIFRSATVATNILYNYTLLNRTYNKEGYSSVNCIIPAGRKFLINIQTKATNATKISTLTFNFTKFGK